MYRYKITIEYDGKNFSGWQKQLGKTTIQGVLQEACEKLNDSEVVIYGAGRTDAGVHAQGQVAHFDLKNKFEPNKLLMALNFHIRRSAQGKEIVVLNVERVNSTFHARYNAVAKVYCYRILNSKTPLALERERAWWVPQHLNIRLMRKASKLLIGNHDFSAFRSSSCQAKTPVKTLDTIKLKSIGKEIKIFLHARSFLHNQVRIIVGTLVEVGRGKKSYNEIRNALKSKTRINAGPTAPAEGLTLINVSYEN